GCRRTCCGCLAGPAGNRVACFPWRRTTPACCAAMRRFLRAWRRATSSRWRRTAACLSSMRPASRSSASWRGPQ
ncbi:unnamed protein product, partial [Prorocentrum cordatum]